MSKIRQKKPPKKFVEKKKQKKNRRGDQISFLMVEKFEKI